VAVGHNYIVSDIQVAVVAVETAVLGNIGLVVEVVAAAAVSILVQMGVTVNTEGVVENLRTEKIVLPTIVAVAVENIVLLDLRTEKIVLLKIVGMAVENTVVLRY